MESCPQVVTGKVLPSASSDSQSLKSCSFIYLFSNFVVFVFEGYHGEELKIHAREDLRLHLGCILSSENDGREHEGVLFSATITLSRKNVHGVTETLSRLPNFVPSNFHWFTLIVLTLERKKTLTGFVELYIFFIRWLYFLSNLPGFNLPASDNMTEDQRVELYHRIIEVWKFGFGLRTELGDMWSSEMEQVKPFITK